MGRASPRLTVGLPVFDAERYLEGAARSILDQTYADFELLIADNASTDGTEELCRELCRGDDRVRYIRHSENIGAGPNHNFVVEQATGELFRWAGDDDLVQPTAFRRCIDLLDDKGPDAVLAFSQTEIIDEHGEHVRYWAEQGAADQGTPVRAASRPTRTPGGAPLGRSHVTLLRHRPHGCPALDPSHPAVLWRRPCSCRRTCAARKARRGARTPVCTTATRRPVRRLEHKL